MSVKDNIEQITEAAEQWREQEYSLRQQALDETLQAPGRWTGPSLNHTLDRWMQHLTFEALSRWVDTAGQSGERPTVAVVHGGAEPLGGFRDALAVWALGFPYVGVLPESSPSLLPAFAEDVNDSARFSIRFASRDEALSAADAVIADPTAEGESLPAACDRKEIPNERRLLRRETFSIGVVDGHESEDEMERLAEDMLLYEGGGYRRLAVLWAPEDHAPDGYLEAMARLRGLFPAHDDTPGTLQMQQAFLEARDESHAYAAGLEFLVSRGQPEPQKAGHVRWSEYDEIDGIHRWWEDHQEEVYSVIARPHLHDRCPEDWPLRTPGGVHVPPLNDPHGQRIIDFLGNLTD